MDQFQQAVAIKAADDGQWGPRDARGRRRVLTAEELDDLADFGWPWDGVKGRLAAAAE